MNLTHRLCFLCLLLSTQLCLVNKSNAATAEAERAAREQEIAQLNAAIKASARDYDDLPKRKFISSSTTEPQYQAYMAEWIRHIEKIGNQHYPEQARQQDLSGKVVVQIAIGRNGELLETEIVQSSGSAILDESVIKITQLASPFKPIPTIDETDILYIIRTWQFVASADE